MQFLLQFLPRGSLSLLPVFVFLSGLIYLDSFKLVRLSSVVFSIVGGIAAAAAALVINTRLIELLHNPVAYSRYIAPAIEEILKALFPFALIRLKRVGFMVDAAIHGFACGAGFALLENIYYLAALQDASLLVWIVRGFGTAVMHGGTAAIGCVMAKNAFDVFNGKPGVRFYGGLFVAMAIHSLFNHVILPPVMLTVVVFAVLPVAMMFVFRASERVTRRWLGVGFDADAEVLRIISSGNIGSTHIGAYLQSLQNRFPGQVVADVLCYLRIHYELAVQAKGILLMRQSGFDVPPDPDVKSKFDEMQYLRSSIGPTGLAAVAPFLHTSSRDLWQLYMLKS